LLGCVWVRWEGRGRCAGCKVAGVQLGVGWAAVRAGGSGVAEVEARVVVKEFVPAVTRRQRRVSTDSQTLDERRRAERFTCKKGAKRGVFTPSLS
jgi:hypothetical protein